MLDSVDVVVVVVVVVDVVVVDVVVVDVVVVVVVDVVVVEENVVVISGSSETKEVVDSVIHSGTKTPFR